MPTTPLPYPPPKRSTLREAVDRAGAPLSARVASAQSGAAQSGAAPRLPPPPPLSAILSELSAASGREWRDADVYVTPPQVDRILDRIVDHRVVDRKLDRIRK